MADEKPTEALLDEALFDPDPVVRDRANQRLVERVEPKWLLQTINALDASRDLTRRRALRLLSNIPPKYSHKHLKAALIDPERALRIRTAAARILTATSDGEILEFTTALTAEDVKIRRASATTSAPKDALLNALFDIDSEVVNRAANALLKREIKLPQQILKRFESVPIQPSEQLVRLIAYSDSTSHLLDGLAKMGLDAVYDYSTSIDVLVDRPILKAWALAQQGRFDGLQGHLKESYVRACLARHLPMNHPQLQTLNHDADTSVSWFAQQNLAGRYAHVQMEKRLEPNPIQLSPSSQAPYGLRASDVLNQTQRVDACLALHQARFNMNLGVAMRSAEAAGINRVIFVGRSDFMRSPARGADLALDVTTCADAAALVTFARENNYQIVAIQQTASSVSYHRAIYPPKPLFVVGSEDAGMPKALRKAADLVVQIPQFGLIDSLNVATAATVVLFHWRVHLADS